VTSCMLIALLALSQSSLAQQEASKFDLAKAQVGDVIPGRYLVAFKSSSAGSSGAALASIAQANVKSLAKSFGNITAEFDQLKGFLISGVSEKAKASFLSSMGKNKDVAFVEQDRVVRATALQTVNKPLSWGLDRVDQRSNQPDLKYVYNDNTAPVNVYVVDTGIRTTHVQFGNRATLGYNAFTGKLDSTDCNGHGTHCAGTIGAKDYGVCKHCKLVAVKVLDCSGSGSYSGVVNGLNWVMQNAAANPAVPAVISMSLGGTFSQYLNQYVVAAINRGITVVAAAGNSNLDARRFSPASVPAAITVGASSKTNTRSSYSNFGPVVDIFAPGDAIVSTWSTSDVAVNTISGTSMATPHVAGIAAIYRSYNPTKTPADVKKFIVDDYSTLNALSTANLGTNTPNRLLYSRVDLTSQTGRNLNGVPDFESVFTKSVRGTLTSTSSQYFSANFALNSGATVQGFLQSTTSESYDLQLSLQRVGSSVEIASTDASNTEILSYKVPSSGTFRWRIYTRTAISTGTSMPFVFKSNA